jgi:hypothetical protein
MQASTTSVRLESSDPRKLWNNRVVIAKKAIWSRNAEGTGGVDAPNMTELQNEYTGSRTSAMLSAALVVWQLWRLVGSSPRRSTWQNFNNC